VVVLEVHADEVRAVLAEVDRPGELLRDAVVQRGPDLVADTASALTALAAGDLSARLLALAVAVGPATADVGAAGLLTALTGGSTELVAGWPLPEALPVLAGDAGDWAAQGAPAGQRPLVAGATVAAARSVGAHAHLPHADARRDGPSAAP
jgi:hypothetical protein